MTTKITKIETLEGKSYGVVSMPGGASFAVFYDAAFGEFFTNNSMLFAEDCERIAPVLRLLNQYSYDIPQERLDALK